ncbi:MAG TPA: hypothetical protein VG122_20655 [Gemmata sp.]|jgi:hypothetical protein|nr:hypothetical protein [Gemmata sp.]
MTQDEIGYIGDRIVEAAFAADGWVCDPDTKQPGSTDIQVHKNGCIRLVQVKTSVIPKLLSALSSNELRKIKSRASSLNCEAWLAQVRINEIAQQVGKTEWTSLR